MITKAIEHAIEERLLDYRQVFKRRNLSEEWIETAIENSRKTMLINADRHGKWLEEDGVKDVEAAIIDEIKKRPYNHFIK